MSLKITAARFIGEEDRTWRVRVNFAHTDKRGWMQCVLAFDEDGMDIEPLEALGGVIPVTDEDHAAITSLVMDFSDSDGKMVWDVLAENGFTAERE